MKALPIARHRKFVDRKDIQGLLASGYDHLDHARFLFLEILNPEQTRIWLNNILGIITNAEYPEGEKPDICVNLAFSWTGVVKLNLSKVVQNFSYEFQRGMYHRETQLILGDTGESKPDEWEFGAENTPLDLLVLLYAKTGHHLKGLHYRLINSQGFQLGLRVIKQQDAVRNPSDHDEPFGFRDGISQPHVTGLLGRRQHTETAINTGEFVLGYGNELDQLVPIPTVDAWSDPLGYLCAHPEHPETQRAFGMNGCYLVFRKLLQKVDDFWGYVENNSKDANGNIDLKKRELIAAKMVGRWRTGSPLVLAPEAPGLEPRNDFYFMDTDPQGLACPIGSHIRRANPRDSLDMPPARSILISRRHRLIRRGRKYLESDTTQSGQPAKKEEGLFFIALNADLRRQFEFIQQLWLNNTNFNGLDNEKDPIAGSNDAAGNFTIPSIPLNQHLNGLNRFVVMRGGGYFFLPGIRAIRFVANFR